MSIIIDNYETIVRTLVHNIRSGKIISKNSEQIDGLNTKDLFNLFTKEFNLTFYNEKIISGLYYDEENKVLGVPFQHKVAYIQNIYFNGIGDLDISEDISSSISSDNFLYFDLSSLNIPNKWLGQHSVLTINYIGFNEVME